MGLFSFIKDAGENIFGHPHSITNAAVEINPKAPAQNLASELTIEQQRAERLEEIIRDLRLQVEDLSVHIDDDTATVRGQAYDQATKEKIVLVIGNNKGISAVDDLMSVEHTQPQSEFHTVVKGDTLSDIANTYYGNSIKYPLIYDANKPMLTDPDKIYPGQVLRIPGVV